MRSATTDKEHLRSVEGGLRVESMKEHVHLRSVEGDLRVELEDSESEDEWKQRTVHVKMDAATLNIVDMLSNDGAEYTNLSELRESFLEHLITVATTQKKYEMERREQRSAASSKMDEKSAKAFLEEQGWEFE